MNKYLLDKTVWNTNDFGTGKWHDNKIHAISFDEKNDELLLDIDHIVQWEKKGRKFLFWICPCTLIFRNVHDFKMEFDSTSTIVLEAYMENPRAPKNADFIEEKTEYDWSIILTSGIIEFKSVGYSQYARRQPILLSQQEIDSITRGGISFGKDFFAN